MTHGLASYLVLLKSYCQFVFSVLLHKTLVSQPVEGEVLEKPAFPILMQDHQLENSFAVLPLLHINEVLECMVIDFQQAVLVG